MGLESPNFDSETRQKVLLNGLEIVRDEYSAYKRFRPYINGACQGELLVYPVNDLWHVEDIFLLPQSRRRGIGSALLRSFAEFVGDNQVVEGSLIHQPSLKAIKINGLVPKAVVGELVIHDPEKLSLVPMVRIFNHGGIEATELKFIRKSGRHIKRGPLASYTVHIYGITRPISSR